jgi:hypothetical protein
MRYEGNGNGNERVPCPGAMCVYLVQVLCAIAIEVLMLSLGNAREFFLVPICEPAGHFRFSTVNGTARGMVVVA